MKPIVRSARGWGVILLLLIVVAAVGIGRALKSEEAVAKPALVRAPILSGTVGQHLIDYAVLDRQFQRLAQEKDMVGLAVAIVENGQLSFVKGYGVTEAGGDDPVTPKTVFRWASLSKGVAATLVASLAEEKKLSLSDPVGRYAPSLKLPGGAERTATIADLLSHRLGLVKNAYDDKLEAGVDPHLIRTELGGLEPYCKPGTCHAYQNVAYDAASEIVQTVTHQSYATQAKKRLFAPLGMDGASLTREGLESSPSWARPHRGRHEMTVDDAYYRVPAAGGMNSSIFDLGLWMRAQMGLVPAVVRPHVLEVIHTPLVDTDGTRRRIGAYDRAMSDAWYGMGWREFHYHDHFVVGHRGAVAGYRSLILFDPEKKAGIAMLWNSESSKPIPAQMEVLDMLYGLPDHDWLGYGKETKLAMDKRDERTRSAR
ncbi:MAG TPA: serine hydrolase domain-containing protein [Sphingomonadaceae bacterium]|nr:serine hydrolase domain-containing protein [Sphingomonadaceae bacterium]